VRGSTPACVHSASLLNLPVGGASCVLTRAPRRRAPPTTVQHGGAAGVIKRQHRCWQAVPANRVASRPPRCAPVGFLTASRLLQTFAATSARFVFHGPTAQCVPNLPLPRCETGGRRDSQAANDCNRSDRCRRPPCVDRITSRRAHTQAVVAVVDEHVHRQRVELGRLQLRGAAGRGGHVRGGRCGAFAPSFCIDAVGA
jgi:hypothetical protein